MYRRGVHSPILSFFYDRPSRRPTTAIVAVSSKGSMRVLRSRNGKKYYRFLRRRRGWLAVYKLERKTLVFRKSLYRYYRQFASRFCLCVLLFRPLLFLSTEKKRNAILIKCVSFSRYEHFSYLRTSLSTIFTTRYGIATRKKNMKFDPRFISVDITVSSERPTGIGPSRGPRPLEKNLWREITRFTGSQGRFTLDRRTSSLLLLLLISAKKSPRSNERTNERTNVRPSRESTDGDDGEEKSCWEEKKDRGACACAR